MTYRGMGIAPRQRRLICADDKQVRAKVIRRRGSPWRVLLLRRLLRTGLGTHIHISGRCLVVQGLIHRVRGFLAATDRERTLRCVLASDPLPVLPAVPVNSPEL